jgi:hypothetical protein
MELDIFYPVNYLQILAFSLLHVLIRPPTYYLFNNSLVLDVLEPITPLDLTNFTDEDKRLGVNLQSIVDRYLTGAINLDTSNYGLLSDLPIEYVLIWCGDLLWHVILTMLVMVVAYKLQQVATLLAVITCQVHQLLDKHQVEAQLVLSDGLVKPTVKVQGPNLMAMVQGVYSDHASHLYQFLQFMVLVVMAWALVIMARMIHRMASTFRPIHTECHSTAYLIVLNKRRSLTVPLLTIPFSIAAMNVTTSPRVSSLKLHNSFFFKRQMIIKWDAKLLVSYLGHKFQFKLPPEINCAWHQLNVLTLWKRKGILQ